jgi:hypothetical protein
VRALATLIAPLALGGCIAGIHEELAYGPSHPTIEPPLVVDEDREGQAGLECRTVTETQMTREVDVRRTFVQDGPFGPQALNAGLASVFGAAAIFIGYDLSNLACSQKSDTGCSGQAQPGQARWEALSLAIAAIPTAFLVANVLRAQPSNYVDRAPPEVTATPWTPCGPAADLAKTSAR